MKVITWSTEERNQLRACDGQVMAMEQREAALAKAMADR
jgi:hypothetical protein